MRMDWIRCVYSALIVAGVLLFLVGGQNVFAHSGNLNKHGCHMDGKKGECHCHRDEQGEKVSPPVISPDRCEKSSPEDDKRSEMDFVAEFCHARGGQIEKSLPHGRRADCITKEHAIEGDFAPKWEEAYRQSRQYARDAGKKAGILLILKKEKDEVYIRRLCKLIADQQAQIDIFAIGHGFAEEGKSVSCPNEI